MDNGNSDESAYSVDNGSIHVEHDYCRTAVTCFTGEKKDVGLGEKCTEHAAERWMDSPSVQVRNDDDCNKCTISAVMGEVLSRASTIFGVPTPRSLSKSRKETSTETPLPPKAAEPEEPSELNSQNASISEDETLSTDIHRNAIDDSGMISQESELSDSITPDFEILRDVPTQPRPAQRLSPVRRSPACRRAVTPDATCDTSIHSQPTQPLSVPRGLPDFQRAFGAMLPSNFSNSSSPPPSLTPHYPSSDAGELVVDPGAQFDNSNNASPPSLTPNFPLSDSERSVRAETSDTSEADVDFGTRYDNSNCDLPPLFSSHERNVRDDISETIREVNDPETQYENSNSDGSPPLFSAQNSPPSDNQETALADTDRVVYDLEIRYENLNSDDSPPLFSTQNSPSSDNQETALKDTGRAVNDLEIRYENSNSDGSPPRFSTQKSPPSDNQETALTDTGRAVDDPKTRYENLNSDGSPPLLSTQNSPPSDNQETALADTDRVVYDLENSNSDSSPSLFSTQNSPPSNNQGTALTDASDPGRAVTDPETQFENTNSGSTVPFFVQDYPPSDKLGTSVTDLSDNVPCRLVCRRYLPRSRASRAPNHPLGVIDPKSDRRGAVIDLETRYQNSNSNGFPTLLSDTLDTRQGVIDLDTPCENFNFSDFRLAQSTTSDLELSDNQRVIDRETGYEYSNNSKLSRSAPTDLESADTQRVVDREIRFGTSNCLELTGSTVPITGFLDTRPGVDNEESTTQNRGPFRRDLNENFVARDEMTPKGIPDEEPESLRADEDYSQSGSPVLEIMSNNLGRLSKVAADSYAISIGTHLSAPGFFTPAQNPENVHLEHSYSERTKKSSVFRTLESEGPENAAKDAHEEPIRSLREFSGSDTSNLRDFERRRVRKIGKRKIDSYESKENRPAKRRRVRDETTRRPNFDSKGNLESERPRVNLSARRESDRTGSNDFSEGLLSNRCCEYDHIFPNVSSVDLSYEPTLLRHLVEPNYEAIKRKIDALMTRIDALGEDF